MSPIPSHTNRPGRTHGASNYKVYRYKLYDIEKGGFKLYCSQPAIIIDYPNISLTKLNKIINHSNLVRSTPIVVVKLKTPINVYKKVYTLSLIHI
ncbi:MAG: hypothetical protein MPK62_07530, partial [Alphaproteobacteria bacterium]|nr:hypothetical protein [Alphaproteobacteria bacterium]